jgi:hypothetical protein
MSNRPYKKVLILCEGVTEQHYALALKATLSREKQREVDIEIIYVIIIVLLAIFLYIAKNHWGLSISILSTISALLFVIDRWLWKYRPFIYLLWVKDFSGRYEGELE